MRSGRPQVAQRTGIVGYEPGAYVCSTTLPVAFRSRWSGFLDGLAFFDDKGFKVRAFAAVNADDQVAICWWQPGFAPLVFLRAFEVGLAEVGVVVGVGMIKADDFEAGFAGGVPRQLGGLRR